MNIAILGYGSQGASAAHHWDTPDNSITVCDGNTDLELPEGIGAQLGAGHLAGLDRFDLIVRSPSVHPQRIVDANNPEILNKVTTNTNEFMHVCPSQNIIGVTGTKGKGTTSTLIARMLEAAGHRVHLGGNIGTPPLQMLDGAIQPNDWVVLELANFQLIDLTASPATAVCLMVEPEHQDWHTSMDEYIQAKQQLFIHQSSGDRAIFYAQNELSQKVVSVSPGQKTPYFAAPGATVINSRIVIGEVDICGVEEIALLGSHNQQNICAAVTAVWPIIQNTEPIRQVITTLGGLPYRIELRKEVNGVRYYNDSFATAPGAAIAAIDAVTAPKVLIMGGHDRGLPLDELAGHIAAKQAEIRHIIIIGASRQRFANELTNAGVSAFSLSDSKDMNSIVSLAASLAQPGDAVVLSPSFASFDMYKNFEVRGNAFNDAVEQL